MSCWDWISVFTRLGVSVVVIIKLWRFYDAYRSDERIGLGIAGGCSLMAAVGFMQPPSGPFSQWATAMFSVGVLIYFVGRLRRQFHHARANRRQVEMAIERKRDQA